MKLMISTVTDQDVERVMSALKENRIGVTLINSTGNFFTPGHATLLIGVEDDKLTTAVKVLEKIAAPRMGTVPYSHATAPAITSFVEVEVGGFSNYVLNVSHFEQV